ncbi:MAG: oligosaccharide flippase family protein, partial [Porticoccus sp.]|nr:oligosaccharide flippase family protein [Porticoccus sp.]
MAIAGVKRLGSSLILVQALQFITFFLMVRYLTIEEMGVVALVAAVYRGLEATTSMGFDKFLLYCDERESQEEVYSVVWSLQIIRGSCILLIAFVLSETMPSFFEGMHDLSEMILIIGVSFFIMAFKNTWLASYERTKDFSLIAKINTMSSLLKGVVICGYVIVYQSPWSYVVGQFLGSLVVTIASFFILGKRPRLFIDANIVREVFKYSKHLIIISFVSFVASQFEIFYVGLTINAATLGVYFTWYRMSKLPRVLMSNLSGRVLFSKASELRRAGVNVIENYHRCGFLFSLIMLAPLYVFLFFHGEFLLSILSGDKYDGTQWLGKYVILINFFFLLSMSIA